MKRILMAFALMPFMALATTYYVNGTTGSDSNPGTSPESAKATIQAAIDVSTDGDEILVAPGTYAPFEVTDVTVQIKSTGGISNTVIDKLGEDELILLGTPQSGMANKYATMVGFTIKVCVAGGGVDNCIVSDYVTTGDHVVFCCAASNCLITRNKSGWSILMHGYANNCTITGNDSPDVSWDNALKNCVIVGNTGSIYASSGVPELWCYNSVLDAPVQRGSDNIVADPKFVDAANGDYRLAAGSPCIDAGNNDYVVGDKDLEGCGRIVNGTVDIGCYEFEPDGGPYVETVGDVDWTYMIKNGRASVGDGTATAAENLAGAVSVPTWLRQRPVNAIDDKAFVDCDAMTALTVPAGIKTMGDSVFEGCSGLKDLYIESDTLSSVGADAFKGCYWDLIVHVPATWQGRGRTLGGYSVWRAGSSDEDKSVSVTVTNVVVQYVLNSVQSEIAVPICGETGFVTVITEITSSGAVSIPVEWKDNYPLFEAKFGTDFANALRSKSGKRDYANKELLVWQDFVAGTDPTDEDDVFSASITMVGDKPMISYTPELSAEETAKRVYTISGKKSLTDGSDWEVVEPGKEADYNFFKVSVRMK